MRRVGGGVVRALALGAVALAAGGSGVYINGTLASKRVRVIEGVAYLPLADVAKATGTQLVKRPDGDFELTVAGGANQVGRFQGKLGEEVFTGQFKVSVLSVEEPTSYTTQYLSRSHKITPESPNQKLVVVHCRLKNGMTTRQKLLMAVGGTYGAPDTALTDTNGQSYAPINWQGNTFSGVDVHDDEQQPLGTLLLPGAATPVNLVFLVPKDTQPKDLIYCVTLYDQYAKAEKKKFVDVRISLNAN